MIEIINSSDRMAPFTLTSCLYLVRQFRDSADRMETVHSDLPNPAGTFPHHRALNRPVPRIKDMIAEHVRL